MSTMLKLNLNLDRVRDGSRKSGQGIPSAQILLRCQRIVDKLPICFDGKKTVENEVGGGWELGLGGLARGALGL